MEVDFDANVKIGDRVKATGYMWRNFSTYMSATKVKKVNALKMIQNQQSLHEGEYHSAIEAYGYEIGHFVEVYNGCDENYVMFEYTGLNGEKLEMAV